MADRRVSVKIDADPSAFVRGTTEAGLAAKAFSKELESADKHMNGLVQAGFALAPAMVPLGAAAIPAVAGLTAELGAATAAVGVAALAFHGIGDALDAVNKYHLDPTEKNLEAMHAALQDLGPAGAEFVRFLDGLRPKLEELQALARDGMFPGLEDGIRSLLGIMPELETLVSGLATEMGKLASEAGKDLAGPQWRAFFDYIDREAAPTLSALGHTLGNVTAGLASMIVAFGPLSSDFTTGMERMSAAFRDWSANVSSTAGFHDFVDYVRKSGPLAMHALESIANALVSVVEAAAPVGQATLPVISALADVLASIAKSPAGPALLGTAAAVAVLAKAATGVNKLSSALDKVSAKALTTEGELTTLGKGFTVAATLGSIVAVTNSLDHLFNMRLDGSNLDRSLTALADGRVTGAILSQFGSDLSDFGEQAYRATDGLYSLQRASAHLPVIGNMLSGPAGDAVANMKELDQALAALVEGGQTQQAAAAFDRFTKAANAQGVSTAKLKALFPEYATAVANADVASGRAAGTTDRFAASTRRFTAVTDANSQALLDNIDAMRKQRSAALAGLNAEIGYQQSLDDARAALAQNGKTLDITTQKGRDNKTALLGVAAAWNQESDAAKNAPGAHRAAIKSFADLATQMGMDHDKAVALAKRIIEMPSKKVNITADASQALRTIAEVNYAHIQDKSFTITTFYDAIHRDRNMATFAPPPGSHPPKRSAAGSTVAPDAPPATAYLSGRTAA